MSRPEKSLRSIPAVRSGSEVSFFDAFDNAPHGMALVAADGTLLHVNRALCVMLGFVREELIDANISAITHPDDFPTEWEQRQRLARANIGRYELTQRYVRKLGETVWVRQSVSATRRLSQLVHFIVEVESVAPPRCPQRDTEAQSLRQLGDAALSAAHEIGNSLTPLMVNTELIVEHARNDHIRELASEVFKAARRIAFTLRRMRKVDDTHPVAYIGEQRMLDLRLVPPQFEEPAAEPRSGAGNSLDSEVE